MQVTTNSLPLKNRFGHKKKEMQYTCMLQKNLQCYMQRPTKDFVSRSSWLVCLVRKHQATAQGDPGQFFIAQYRALNPETHLG